MSGGESNTETGERIWIVLNHRSCRVDSVVGTHAEAVEAAERLQAKYPDAPVPALLTSVTVALNPYPPGSPPSLTPEAGEPGPLERAVATRAEALTTAANCPPGSLGAELHAEISGLRSVLRARLSVEDAMPPDGWGPVPPGKYGLYADDDDVIGLTVAKTYPSGWPIIRTDPPFMDGCDEAAIGMAIAAALSSSEAPR